MIVRSAIEIKVNRQSHTTIAPRRGTHGTGIKVEDDCSENFIALEPSEVLYRQVGLRCEWSMSEKSPNINRQRPTMACGMLAIIEISSLISQPSFDAGECRLVG